MAKIATIDSSRRTGGKSVAIALVMPGIACFEATPVSEITGVWFDECSSFKGRKGKGEKARQRSQWKHNSRKA